MSAVKWSQGRVALLWKGVNCQFCEQEPTCGRSKENLLKCSSLLVIKPDTDVSLVVKRAILDCTYLHMRGRLGQNAWEKLKWYSHGVVPGVAPQPKPAVLYCSDPAEYAEWQE